MCELSADGLCEVWRETPRMARRERKCNSCGGNIRRGEAYLDHFDLFEGEPTSASMCFACWLSRKELSEAHDGFISHPNNLSEDISHCADESREYDDDDNELPNRWDSLWDATFKRVEVERA